MSFECDICLKKFTRKIYLKEHKKSRRHTRQIVNAFKKFKKVSSKMYKCKICGVTIFRKINLKLHFKRLHFKSEINFNVSYIVVKTPQSFKSLAKKDMYEADESEPISESEKKNARTEEVIEIPDDDDDDVIVIMDDEEEAMEVEDNVDDVIVDGVVDMFYNVSVVDPCYNVLSEDRYYQLATN